jgi:hypothetical protein
MLLSTSFSDQNMLFSVTVFPLVLPSSVYSTFKPTFPLFSHMCIYQGCQIGILEIRDLGRKIRSLSGGFCEKIRRSFVETTETKLKHFVKSGEAKTVLDTFLLNRQNRRSCKRYVLVHYNMLH